MPEIFPTGFIPVIKVLDLSHSYLTMLPVGIGKLVSLQTGTRELPMELKDLTNKVFDT